ncbi:hypothetical protein D3C76_47680 [compost metagenome]
MKPRNWTSTGFAAGAWLPLVTETAALKTVIICNTTASAQKVSLRITWGPEEVRSLIVNEESVEAGKSVVLDLILLNLSRSDQLQIKLGDAGLSVTASGDLLP